MHTAYSDGSDSIKELAAVITGRGLSVFAVTDHDTTDGCEEMKKILPRGLTFICGEEFSSKTKIRECHILGYNMDIKNEGIISLNIRGMERRREKAENRLNFLREAFNIKFTDAELEKIHSSPYCGKPVIAAMLVEKGIAPDKRTAIKDYIEHYTEKEIKPDAIEVISAIHGAGGLAVWAHPLGGEGETHISGDGFISQLALIRSAGIDGLECYYSRYTDAETEYLRSAAESAGLYISGGSDYHGENKTVRAGELNCNGTPVPSEKLTVLSALL